MCRSICLILNGIHLFLDLVEYSKEQIEFLDKFFKDNPWADHAHIELIVKQTGLNEIIIKVKHFFIAKIKKKSLGFFLNILRIILINVE